MGIIHIYHTPIIPYYFLFQYVFNPFPTWILFSKCKVVPVYMSMYITFLGVVSVLQLYRFVQLKSRVSASQDLVLALAPVPTSFLFEFSLSLCPHLSSSLPFLYFSGITTFVIILVSFSLFHQFQAGTNSLPEPTTAKSPKCQTRLLNSSFPFAPGTRQVSKTLN